MIKLTDIEAIVRAKSDTELLNQILADNLDFVRFIVWKYMKPLMGGDLYYEPDDMFQEGYLAFIEAVRDFDPTRAAFTTFAAAKIRWRLLKFIRMNRKGGIHMSRKELDEGVIVPIDSLDKTFSVDDEDDLSVIDIIGINQEEEYIARANLAIRSASLSLRDKWIMMLRYLGYSQSEIGRKFGLSQAAISRRLQRVHQVITA